MTPEQQRLFVMLEELVGICEAHGLTYYVAGGTTLGAVRHKGFIPWDDDIDIMMPYRDWCALVDVARSGGLPENRVLNCLELDPNYPHVFGRYTDVTSCAIHYNQLLGGTPEGFIIDIFVLDAVPDAGQGFERHRRVLSLYNDLANDFGYSYPMTQDRGLLERYSRRVKREGRKAVLDELAAELSCHDPASCDYLVMRWAAAPRLFHKDIFAFPRYEEFEGLRVSVPGKTSDYLVQHYGDDWMYVPSSSGRVTHDAITFLDVDYKTVQQDYLSFLDVDRARRAVLNRRSYHIRHMRDLKRSQDMTAGIFASFARAETLRRAARHEGELESAVVHADYELLDWVFAEFYRVQNMPDLAGREEYLTINRYYDPMYVDIGDNLLTLALGNLIDTNRTAQAARIMRVRERVGGELSDTLRGMRDKLEAVRLPKSLADIGMPEQAEELARYVLEQWPANFENRVFLLELLSARCRYDEVRQIAAAGLELYPQSGEFKKYLADVSFAKASDEEGRRESFALYEEALAQTTHAGLSGDVRRKADRHPALVTERLAALLEVAAEGRHQAVPTASVAFDAATMGEKTMRLLEEIHDICNDHGIEHFLGCVSSRLAYTQGDNSCGLPVLDLYVPAARFDELARAITANMRPERFLDYWKTNENHLGYQMDYVDKTTTYLQLDEGFNIVAHGAKVTITPIRTLPTERDAQRLEALETGWEINGYQLTKKISGKRLASAGVARVGMAAGRKHMASKLFDVFNEEYGKPASGDAKVVIRLPHGKTYSCRASDFAVADSVMFGGGKFPVAHAMRSLLDRWCGPQWASERDALKPPEKNVLISADLPYEELVAELEGAGCSLSELFSLMKRIRISMLPLVNDLRVRNRAMHLAARSEERKRCYDYLHEHEGEIENALERDDFVLLQRLFERYDKSARRFLEMGLALCPSKHYLDILCTLWRKQGDGEIADKLAALAPESHYTPLGHSLRER